MKNQCKRLFVSVLCLLLLLPVMAAGVSIRAEAATEGDWTYKIVAGNAIITGYTGWATTIVVPDTLGGKPVTEMGEKVFFGRTNLTDVTFPDSLKTIGNYAFSESGLTTLTLPDGLTAIGEHAFSNCENLTSASIPGSLNTISFAAFFDCVKLTTVNLSEGLEIIGDGAFQECISLANITLPNGLKEIGDSAFWFCYSLPNIAIPGSVTVIGPVAFAYCSKITSVTIPDGVTVISTGVFQGCIGLTSVTLPKNLRSIGRIAFNGCTGLTGITIPSSVTWIEERSFSDCDPNKLVINCMLNSAAHRYAEKNEYQFVLMDGAVLTVKRNGDKVAPTFVAQQHGTTYTLPVLTRNGYTHTGWTLSGGGSLNGRIYTFGTTNGTVTATWIVTPTYTLTLNANGGAVTPKSIVVSSGGTYKALPTPLRPGHRFDGWFTAAKGGTEVKPADKVTLTGNATLYARWTKTIAKTGYPSTFWNWIMFIFLFGFIWMKP